MRANVGRINFIKLTEEIKLRRSILCLYSNAVWHHPICAPTPMPVIYEAKEVGPRSIPLNSHREAANESNCQILAIQGNDTGSTSELALLNHTYKYQLTYPHENTVRYTLKRCIYMVHTRIQIKKNPRGSNLIVTYLVVPSCNFLLLISLYSLP